MTLVAIFDIDGTIADVTHRLPLILDPKVYGAKKQWTKFHEACEHDSKIEPVTKFLTTIANLDYEIWLFTARPEWTRELTAQWLRRHSIPYSRLRMRDDDDYSCDVDVKRHMYHHEIATAGEASVQFVVEDRTRVVEMWRSLGLICLQCAPGNY